jgi:putative ABC transport system permease protein
MISSYKQITGKYLSINKKRTMLTIIGIILSVALISAIGFFFKSMSAAQIEDVKSKYGSMHLIFMKADDSLVTKVKTNPNVLRSGVYSVGETKDINDKLKAKEIFGSDEALALLPYKLKEGRFPQNDNEVAMESWFIGKIKNGAKVGENIKVLDKEYTLVGILNNTTESQKDGVGELFTKKENASNATKIFLVQLKSSKNMKEKAEEIKKLANGENVGINNTLLDMEGQGVPKELFGALTVIISIVVIATIAVIYNSFQISVVERVKQFGLLRAIGTTPKQIRKIILREATFLAAIGIPIGLFFGIIALYGIYFCFKIIGGEEVAILIAPTISLDVIGISGLVGIVSIYLSALIPAFFAGKISPLVAISSRNSITKEKLKRRSSFIAGKLFGFEGALAQKNIKRNRKRYRTTVFSIVISVTLFITFKSFMDMSLNVYDNINESDNVHFSIKSLGNSSERQSSVGKSVIEKINNLSQVKTVYKEYGNYEFSAAVDRSKELEDIRSLGDMYKDINYNGQDKSLLKGSLAVYDEKSFEVAKDYLKEGKIDLEELNKENGVIVIGKNTIYNEKTRNNFYGPIVELKVGDEIALDANASTEKVGFGKGEVKKVKVLAVLNDVPFTYNGSQKSIRMITTAEMAKKLTGKNIDPISVNIKLKDIKLESEANAELEKIVSSEWDLTLINKIDKNRNSKSLILMIQILLYGFVIVVSLIGSVNIINTLTTNIILRKREFAALKSIGLTQRGLKKIITLEGLLYGIMGSIYGGILGCLLSYSIYSGMNNVREQSYSLPYQAITIAAIGAMLIGYLSVLAPLKRMKNENLIEAIREDF